MVVWRGQALCGPAESRCWERGGDEWRGVKKRGEGWRRGARGEEEGRGVEKRGEGSMKAHNMCSHQKPWRLAGMKGDSVGGCPEARVSFYVSSTISSMKIFHYLITMYARVLWVSSQSPLVENERCNLNGNETYHKKCLLSCMGIAGCITNLGATCSWWGRLLLSDSSVSIVLRVLQKEEVCKAD